MWKRMKVVNGTLSIESELRRGTTVRARVPFDFPTCRALAAVCPFASMTTPQLYWGDTLGRIGIREAWRIRVDLSTHSFTSMEDGKSLQTALL
jgi:hypothetical protein